VLSAGEVVEQGTPQELISNGGWFASFASASEERAKEEPMKTMKGRGVEIIS
jgi:hypothetical protein